MRRLLLAVFVLLLAAASCSNKKDEKKDEGPWDARAVWNFQGRSTDEIWRQECGVSPAAISAQNPCVVQVMMRDGASQQAIDFLRQNGYFLIAFLETGKVDYGRGAAPWINMGRPTQQLFLNGTPTVQEATMLIPRDWQTDAQYADFAKKQPQAFPWAEYGELVDSTTLRGGGQEFLLEFPLQMCRACPDLAYLRMNFRFDPEGALLRAELAPLVTP